MREDKCQFNDRIELEVRIAFIVINIVLVVFICSGNILTILTVWKTPKLRTVPNMYVLSLAFADLTVGCLAVPIMTFFFIPPLNDLQNFSKPVCLLGFVTFFMSVTTSINSMALIAMDRAFYIGYPLHYRRLSTVTKARIIITCTWVISLIIATIPIYFNKYEKCKGCTAFNVIPMEYQVYIQIPLIVTVCIINAVCYGIIFKIARSKREIRVNERPRNLETDMKLVKIFLLVFGLFVICWTPLITMVALGHLIGLYYKYAVEISLLLPQLNSGMNFFVYVMKNAEFREAIMKLFCRPCKIKQSNNAIAATTNF